VTTAEARDDLLGLIGIADVSHADSAVLTRILRDQNSVIQTIWTMLPPNWNKTPGEGELLAGPAQLSGLTLTHGAKSITGGSFTAAQVGCTIRLAGDPNDNLLATTTTLSRPYLGPSTGTGTGMLFGDCITLGTSAVSVLPPVVLLGEHELTPLRGRRDLQTFSSATIHYASYADRPEAAYSVADPRDVNRPIGYLVEQQLVGSRVQLRLRVSPLPDRDYVVQFDVRSSPPRVTALDTTEIPMPQENLEESIFLPMLRFAFSSWKHFPQEAKSGLKEASDTAFGMLTKLKPQTLRIGRVDVRAEDR
jgi:hypothetical protein